MKNEKVEMQKIIDGLKFNFSLDEKKKFLTQINNNSPKKTTQLYIAVLKKVEEAEALNNKEWYRFTEEQVDSAIVDFKSKSIITLQSYVSIIRDYLVDTVPKMDIALTGYLYTIGLTKNDLLDLDEYGNEKPESMKKYYINKIGETMQYITEDELDKILSCQASPSSKALVILLFNGVKGAGFSKIGNIRESDIDLETGIVKGESGEVLYAIDDKYKQIFKDALEEEYLLEYDYDGNLVNKAPLVQSEYFIKRTQYRLYAGLEPADTSVINKRIKSLGKSAGNPHISPTSILNSGLTIKLLKECGGKQPTTVQLEEFRGKYNVKLSYVSVKSISKILADKTSPSK